jgi:hypothetical protein
MMREPNKPDRIGQHRSLVVLIMLIAIVVIPPALDGFKANFFLDPPPFKYEWVVIGELFLFLSVLAFSHNLYWRRTKKSELKPVEGIIRILVAVTSFLLGVSDIFYLVFFLERAMVEFSACRAFTFQI